MHPHVPQDISAAAAAAATSSSVLPLPPQTASSKQTQPMANQKASLVVLLILAVSAATAGAVAAVDLAALEEEKFFLPVNPGDLLDPSRIAKCWAPIMGIEGCIKDVLSSFLSFQVHLSKECCGAIEGIDKNCFLNIFSTPPFNLFFPPLLKAFCSDKSSPPSSPAKA